LHSGSQGITGSRANNAHSSDIKNRCTSGRRIIVESVSPNLTNKYKLFWDMTECSPVEVRVTFVATASIFRV
jgi:hypothetical protein